MNKALAYFVMANFVLEVDFLNDQFLVELIHYLPQL